MPFDPAAGEDAKKSLLLALAERWLDHSTGCFASEADRAERKLAEYIASKYQTARKERDLGDIYVADVLSIYVDDCGPRQRNCRKFDERINRLNDFWGGKRLSEVNGESCRPMCASVAIWAAHGEIWRIPERELTTTPMRAYTGASFA